jgi:dienelactone hydrolase
MTHVTLTLAPLLLSAALATPPAAAAVQQDAKELPLGASQCDACLLDGLLEIPVTIGEGKWAVPGILTAPKGKGRYPVAVLVHGFGPGSIDGDVGPNKVMRETSIGLAREGVAALRFAKRTTTHRKLFSAEKRRATIEEEWIDDAVAAVRQLRGMSLVDPARIYIVGHSAGGGMAPRIALLSGAAGAVIVNGATREAGDMIKEQMEYVASLSENPSLEERARQATMLLEVERLRRDEPADDEVILNQPMWFWRSMRKIDSLKDISLLTGRGGRVLIAQGARDYLTTEVDWKGFQSALSGNPHVRMERFPALNHMMQEGTGRMTPAEYQWKKPVSTAWTATLAKWITGTP